MSPTPTISVAMGVYNASNYLPETIESVLCQTEADFEFIIVNDGSTDDAVAQILYAYKNRDARIRIITQKNQGLTHALIDGCAAAKGAYIARVDVGDVMVPDRLARQKAVLDVHAEVVLVTCWTECCGPEWEHLYTTKEKRLAASDQAEWVADVLSGQADDDLLDGPSHHGSVMFRVNAYREVGGYRPVFYYGQDWDLWYRLAEVGKFAGVRDVLYRCRIFPEGISMQNVERQREIHVCSRGAFLARRNSEDEEQFLESAASTRPGTVAGNNNTTASSGQKLAAGNYFVGEALRRNGDVRCRKYFRSALRLMPASLKLWVRLGQSLMIPSTPN